MDHGALFAKATDSYLAHLYAADPVLATAMGVHEHDDRLPNYARHALDEHLRRTRAYLHEIDPISVVGMAADERVDYRIARAWTQMAISRMEQARPLERQPGAYVETLLAGVYYLMVRRFAPVEQRAAAVLARLREAPKFLLEARQNLASPPRLFTEIGIETAEGGLAFFAEAIPAFAAQLGASGLQQALREAAEDAAEALESFTRYLREELLPGASDEFAIGPELFAYMLRVGHMLDEDLEGVLAIGEQELESTKCEIDRVARQIDPSRTWPEIVDELKQDHPTADGLIAAYAREMERAREFVAFHRLVDFPENESLAVVETPAFQRSLLPYAAYMPAAPFETAQDAMFWVTPIDAAATETEREAQLQGHSLYNLPIIALHEAYPGHHMQFSWQARHPSRFRRHFADSNLFVEGWALYCEEMMYAQGFYVDPRVRLMQLKAQLWRACRVIIEVKLHACGMGFDEAVAFLVTEAKLEEAHARAEVKRYAISPTQPLSYIVGKRQILDLKERLERKQGARFDLRRFHNDLMSYGAVPPRVIRETMFAV